MADVLGPLASQYRRVSSLVTFYRQAHRAERLAFLEQDKRAVTTCEAGLSALGVLDAKEKWWAMLPVLDLSNEQAEKLERDVNHQLILVAALWLKDGKESAAKRNEENKVVPQRAVFDVLTQVQQYHEYKKLPRSVAAHLLETYSRASQLQLNKIRKFASLEPTTASDCYFVGIALQWMGQSPNDWISKALSLTLGLLGLDLGEPGPAAQRLLRRAAAEEPSHFWSHYWLGWALLAAEDAEGAELAFTTCLTLRPGDGPALAERARALAVQTASADDERARRELKARCLTDAERAAQHAPHDWYVRLVLADVFARMELKDRAIQATTKMLELMPITQFASTRPPPEQIAVLQVAKTYLGEPVSERPEDADGWSIVALNCLLLGDLDGARAAADKALRAVPGQPRAAAVRSTVALFRKETKEALADLEVALKKEPRNFLALLGKASAREQLGDWLLAQAGYDALKRIAVTDWQELQAELGNARVLRLLGRQREAEHALERARVID
jgi:hypothetical protein